MSRRASGKRRRYEFYLRESISAEARVIEVLDDLKDLNELSAALRQAVLAMFGTSKPISKRSADAILQASKPSRQAEEVRYEDVTE